jgi:hypothetical protein
VIAAFCPWLTAVALSVFFLVFAVESEIGREGSLRRAFLAGAGGYVIMALAQSTVLVNFLLQGRLTWLADLFSAGPAVFALTASLSFLAIAYFYVAIIRRDP